MAVNTFHTEIEARANCRAKTALHSGRPGTVDQVAPDRQVEPVRRGELTVARELHDVVLG